MNLTIFNVIGFLVGILISSGGFYYLIKEKNDVESRKIYSVVSVIGVVILVVMIIRIFVLG